MAKLVVKIPITWMTEPMTKAGLKRPASNARPEKAPKKNRIQTWIEPIQDIVDGVSSSIDE